ncbi:DUF2970 domain-containing protein [Algiphilus sp. W345]|uniref:DUF2970 domain-containing protein n=1 Tax=Banduia mediterranea TaxID=3075609 RepID=A0ABU2WII7_9GAMM|nr:DUF2970 domain-containing protein [Algiphilus sp. W345]MDT0497693.1 DUF2970 domain-containing protein [Algiphilus sp. W345]
MFTPRCADKSPGPFDQLLSVLAAFFGVQSRRNRERDFKHGKAINFVILGVVMTIVFVIVLALVVKLVLRSAGVS